MKTGSKIALAAVAGAVAGHLLERPLKALTDKLWGGVSGVVKGRPEPETEPAPEEHDHDHDH